MFEFFYKLVADGWIPLIALLVIWIKMEITYARREEEARKASYRAIDMRVALHRMGIN